MYLQQLRLLFICTSFVFVSCVAVGSEIDNASAVKPDFEPSDGLKRAADAYDKRANLDEARKSVEILAKTRNPNNRNFEVEWRFAQYSYYLGSQHSVSDEESESILQKALGAAQIASRVHPEKPDGHFWYGAILGEQSRRSPVTVGIPSIKKIRLAMKKVIAIEPGYHSASSYDALGQVELESRGLAGGDPKKALEHFKKAIELKTQNPFVHLNIGKAYLALNQDSEAKKHLRQLISLSPTPEFEPELEEAKARAKKILAKKF